MCTILILLLLISGGVSAAMTDPAETDGRIPANEVQAPPEAVGQTPPPETAEADKGIEQEKKELRLMLMTSLIVLSLFFLGVLMITFLRIGRRYKRRIKLGQPDKPTEYVDAWSQYRLKEDDQQKE